jgi:hypothetical protein
MIAADHAKPWSNAALGHCTPCRAFQTTSPYRQRATMSKPVIRATTQNRAVRFRIESSLSEESMYRIENSVKSARFSNCPANLVCPLRTSYPFPGFDNLRKALRRFPASASEHAGQFVQAFSWRYTLSGVWFADARSSQSSVPCLTGLGWCSRLRTRAWTIQRTCGAFPTALVSSMNI